MRAILPEWIRAIKLRIGGTVLFVNGSFVVFDSLVLHITTRFFVDRVVRESFESDFRHHTAFSPFSR